MPLQTQTRLADDSHYATLQHINGVGSCRSSHSLLCISLLATKYTYGYVKADISGSGLKDQILNLKDFLSLFV